MQWKSILITSACACALAASAAPKASTKLSEQDRHFLRFAAETDMAEAHSGQIAANNASSRNVKDFGQKLTQDFSNAYGRLLVLAQDSGQTIPRGIDVRRDRDISRLEQLHGRAFDEQFVREQIRKDQSVIAGLRREAEHGQDKALRDWAQQSLATVESDLMRERQIAKAEKWRS